MKNKLILCLFVCVFALSSCEDNNGEADAPMRIDKVFLEDIRSSVPDRQVDFVRVGQTIRLEGSGFAGVKQVYVNGRSLFINPVYITDRSMVFTIQRETPTLGLDDAVRNTIRLVKSEKNQLTYLFPIRAAAPVIDKISHTLPLEGEWITLEGSGLTEISKVVFPGDVEVNADIEQSEDGLSIKVKVPSGMSEKGGSIYVEGVNGGGYSPAYFNCKAGMMLDFDGNGVAVQAAWGSSFVYAEDLLSNKIGEGHVSQGNYCPITLEKLLPISAGKSRAVEVQTTGGEDWRSYYVPSLFTESTPLSEIAFQFDIYVPEYWNNSGFIGICLVNNFSADNMWKHEFYNYIPWLVDGKKVPFKTLGWTTVTIPMNKFYKYSDKEYSFDDILKLRETASNKNFGVMFHNNDFTMKDITGKSADESVEFLSSSSTVRVYIDNFRLVSLKTPTFSDFPDEK